MAENILHGVPLTTDFPISIGKELEDATRDQKTEIEEIGVKVTGIHVTGEGAPPRFFIQFPPGKPSFEFRTKLEARQFDVGQQQGKKMLQFYATRRSIPSEGWEV